VSRHNTPPHCGLLATVPRSVGGLPAPVYRDTFIGGTGRGMAAPEGIR